LAARRTGVALDVGWRGPTPVSQKRSPFSRGIAAACDKLIAGEMREQFVTDFIQGGAATSTNMNANEVIANVALELLGHKKGEYRYVSPKLHEFLSEKLDDDDLSEAMRLVSEALDPNAMVPHDQAAAEPSGPGTATREAQPQLARTNTPNRTESDRQDIGMDVGMDAAMRTLRNTQRERQTRARRDLARMFPDLQRIRSL